MSSTPWYATREEVKAELDVKETARSNARIDRALADATEAVHGLTHREFYPVLATRGMDWPARPASASGVLRLGHNEVISVASLTSGGTLIDPADYTLRRADDVDSPPYTRIELSLASNATFGNGNTWQQDVLITGLFGYRNDETPAGALAAPVASPTASTITVNGPASAALGIGSLLRVGDERMIVTGRSMLDTGQGFGDSMTNVNNDVTIGAADGTAYAVGEMVMRDAERMLITEIAGNTLIVTRAWDGSPLAAHTDSAIYAPRVLTVTRGALGTTAAAHADGAAVARWDAPGSVRQLCLAEALVNLMQGRSAYARTAGSGESERETSGRGLADLRDRVYASHGRKARSAAV
ncbi:hypothetical protein ACFU96_21770 [Streptomyces sp. NPDC057620]|uniref:hypothetical protein n=1 Tax=Streptomyces sp. NPDC057620 TaxID=3346185 RepID=UPI00368FFE82